MNMKTKELTQITKEKLGRIDGIQRYGNQLMISLWGKGEVVSINDDGETQLIYDTGKSVGDILYIESSKQLFLPMNLQNGVEGYQL